MRFYNEGKIWPCLQGHGGKVYYGLAAEHSSFWADWMPKKIGEKISKVLFSLYRRGLPDFIDDLIAGFIAGIPICCTFYFSRKAKGRQINEWYFPETIEEDKLEIAKGTPYWLEYVPCPYCRQRKRFAQKENDTWIPIRVLENAPDGLKTFPVRLYNHNGEWKLHSIGPIEIWTKLDDLTS